jgi:hypothetical protein
MRMALRAFKVCRAFVALREKDLHTHIVLSGTDWEMTPLGAASDRRRDDRWDKLHPKTDAVHSLVP